MFFTISPEIDDRFNQHHRIGNFWFSHDDGWTQLLNGWHKGYGSGDFGNWCSVTVDQSGISVNHDLYRGFPLWWDGKSLTNLLGSGQNIWADDHVVITPTGLVAEKKNVIGEIDGSIRSPQEVLSAVADRLEYNLSWLAKNLSTHPRKLFLSGGIDTAVLYAIAKHLGIDFELIDYEYFKYDWFTNHNITNIRKQHWAYRQIHHWAEECILITGGCGDEFLFRGPTQIATWSAWHDIDLEAFLRNNNGYHKDYFLADKNLPLIRSAYQNRHRIKAELPTRRDLLQRLLDVNINDHQHWHLGNTLTYTPFKDLEITKIILSLPPEELLKQILDANISRQLIENFYPSASVFVSNSKNYNHRRSLNV